MPLATQDLYSERADAYAKMSSLIWRLVDLRENYACSLVRLIDDKRPPLPSVEQTEAFQKIKLEQLAEKARWLKACTEIRAMENSNGS